MGLHRSYYHAFHKTDCILRMACAGKRNRCVLPNMFKHHRRATWMPENQSVRWHCCQYFYHGVNISITEILNCSTVPMKGHL